MTNVKVPYINLVLQHQNIKSELLEAFQKVLKHGNFILGPEVFEFEKAFADYCGTKYALGVDNGTSALFLVMKALGVGAGDEVITAPNSFLASASSITLAGAKPVFVDVKDDFNINPALLEKAITRKTKAIIPVHLTGRPCEMEAILEIARKKKLYVIEDCAQAVGACYKGKKVGQFGIAGCFSLHPLKNLNAIGDGGVITTNNTRLYECLRKARNHGLKNRDVTEFWSYNCRLDTIQAAMLLVKMKYLNNWIQKRRENALYYYNHLQYLMQVPCDGEEEFSVYHTFIVQTKQRDDLQAFLSQNGIETKIHYPIPIHLQPAAKDLKYKKGDFPMCERQTQRILSLPVHPELSQKQKECVVLSIIKYFRQKGAGA